MSPRKVSHNNSGWRISTHVTLTNFSYRGPPNNVRHSWQVFSMFGEYCSLWSVCGKLVQSSNLTVSRDLFQYDFISNDHGPEILHRWSSSLWPLLSAFLISLNGFTTVQKDAENSNCMMLIQMLRISKKNNSNDESTRSR